MRARVVTHPRRTTAGMRRRVMWSPVEADGSELVELRTGTLVRARGIMVGSFETPYALRYEIECDADWRLRGARIECLLDDELALELRVTRGEWALPDGGEVRELRGCTDLAIASSMFALTPPLRRLPFEPGASHVVPTAYVRIPELTLLPIEQRFTMLERDAHGASYRVESLRFGQVVSSTTIPVDADGVVLDYPGFFRRVAGSESKARR
jgi:uncharacterized protein